MEISAANQPVTINPGEALAPASDFRFLRSEGIHQISRLAATSWTDYNTHDPGITLLDVLCYAITDISYRLGYDIKDLLATPAGNPYASLYSPATVLTTHPLTLLDYRKLLVDVEGITNAWLQKQKGITAPVLYYYPSTDTGIYRLNNVAGLQNQPLTLKGLYTVQLATELPGGVQKATERLMATRNLCEDFASIKELPPQYITVSGTIEVGKTTDINQTAASVLYRLSKYISPRVVFRTLAQMLDRGKTTDEIFDGPALQHGFIEDDELAGYQKKKVLPVSDVIREMMDEDGVLFVSGITVSASGSGQVQSWLLETDDEKIARLDVAATFRSLVFMKAGTILTLNPDLVNTWLQKYEDGDASPILPISERDIVVPSGKYQPLADYYSIQHHLPQVYGLGNTGLPESASPLRQAQAAQLQAFLLLFEQILTNCTSQVAGLKDLFSFYNDQPGTYFHQQMRGKVPGVEKLIASEADNKLGGYTETQEQALTRKNRFLDHLIARFGESLTDYTLQMQSYGQQVNALPIEVQQSVVDAKLNFLRNFPVVAGSRSTGADYTQPSGNDNGVSGLQKRIASKMGLVNSGIGDTGQEERFYVVEHLLLRPMQEDINGYSLYANANPGWLSWHSIQKVEPTDARKWVITSKEHGLITGDLINYRATINLPIIRAGLILPGGIPTNPFIIVSPVPVAVTYLTPDTFSITGGFPDNPNFWSRYVDNPLFQIKSGQPSALPTDPFSLQLTFVFPEGAGRFANKEFKAFTENLVRKEVPAHLTVYIRWLGEVDMAAFAHSYKRFFAEKSIPPIEPGMGLPDNRLAQRAWRNRLIETVVPGSSSFPLSDIPLPEEEVIVNYNQPAVIELPYSQAGMTYTLSDEFGTPMNGTGTVGTDGPLTLNTMALTKDLYRMNIWVSAGAGKPKVRLYQTVIIRLGINNKLIARVKDGPIAYGGKATIIVEAAQSDTGYQLLDSKKKPLSQLVTTPANIVQDVELQTTDPILEDTTLTVAVSNTHSSASSVLEMQPVILVYPSTDLKPEADSPSYDYGSTATITLKSTQTTANYQLWREAIDNDLADPTRQPIGDPQVGAKKALKFTAPNLTEDLTVSVLAHKTDSGLEQPITTQLTLLVKPAVGMPLSVVEPLVKAGQPVTIRVSNTQRGVLYQLRKLNGDGTFTNIGVPAYHHKNYGIGKARIEVEFAIDRFTDDFVLLSAGVINQTTMFDVLATKATTRLQAVVGTIKVEIKA